MNMFKLFLVLLCFIFLGTIVSAPWIMESGVRPADDVFVQRMMVESKKYPELDLFVTNKMNDFYISIKDYKEFIDLEYRVKIALYDRSTSKEGGELGNLKNISNGIFENE